MKRCKRCVWTRINQQQSPVATMLPSLHAYLSVSSASRSSLFCCCSMVQSWYVFTSSHISSTVIKTIMKLRNSSFAERSMVGSQMGRREQETIGGECWGAEEEGWRGVAPFWLSVLDLRGVQWKIWLLEIQEWSRQLRWHVKIQACLQCHMCCVCAFCYHRLEGSVKSLHLFTVTSFNRERGHNILSYAPRTWIHTPTKHT